MEAEEILKNVKIGVLEQIYLKLKDYDETEIYFHDIVSNEIDSQTPQDKKTCVDLIEMANESYFDMGLIDESSFERSLITRAYCSIEQNLFNDDFIQKLQEKLNNEVLSKQEAKILLKEVEMELKSLGYYLHKPIYEDNQTQIYLKVGFSFEDFKRNLEQELLKRGFIQKQLINLSDSFKILTSNKSINQNALIIEEKKKGLFRVYLMQKDKELDIRNLFKGESINAENGFNLSPSFYIEQKTEQYEQDKKTGKKNYQNEFKNLEVFLNKIARISNKLTELTI